MEQIIIAYERQDSCDRVRRILEEAGEFSCTVCRSGAKVRRAANKLRSGLVVCGFKLLDESCESIYHDLPDAYVMLMTASAAQLELCETKDIFKLALPAHSLELRTSVRLLAQLAAARVPPPERGQEERELVGRAKQLLMKHWGMNEEQAHRLLQKRSMDSGIRLAEIARQVLEENRPGKGT